MCDILTVSGSFSNTSLASSLVHFSSTHSLSKCPCFVSSKTWFALLCLLRNWFASWGDNETKKKKRRRKTSLKRHELTYENKRRSNNSGVKQYFWLHKNENMSERLRNICCWSTVDNMYHHQPQHKCQLSELASHLACNCLLTAVGPADNQQY